MDPWIIVGLIVVVVPVAVVWALAKSAALRGAEPRGGSRRGVASLVTEVIADDRPEEERDHPDDPKPANDASEQRPGTGPDPLPPDTWR